MWFTTASVPRGLRCLRLGFEGAFPITPSFEFADPSGCGHTSNRVAQSPSFRNSRPMRVADDLAVPRLVKRGRRTRGRNGLGEKPAGRVAEELGQDVSGIARWPADRQRSGLFHGGVLLGDFGRLVVLRSTKGTPPKSNRRPQLPVIALHELPPRASVPSYRQWVAIVGVAGVAPSDHTAGCGSFCDPVDTGGVRTQNAAMPKWRNWQTR